MQQGVSIIICTFNGKDRLSPTLGAIWNLDSGVSKELILVDNGSSDGTGDWIKFYFQDHPAAFPIRYLSEPKPGLLNARLAGIRSATFEFLLFCDDDNQLFPDYLSLGFGLLNSNPLIGVLGGQGIVNPVGRVPEWLIPYQKSFALGPQTVGSGKISETPAHVYGAGSFFRKQALLELITSGYRFFLMGRTQNQAISGDDLELCWLMQLMGYEIHFEENLRFYHAIPESRFTLDYLIRMKSGTALGAALLFAYRYFFRFSSASSTSFSRAYVQQRIKADLIYFRNRFRLSKKKKSWEDDLALSILDARRKSFSYHGLASKSLFEQLKSYQSHWKLTL